MGPDLDHQYVFQVIIFPYFIDSGIILPYFIGNGWEFVVMEYFLKLDIFFPKIWYQTSCFHAFIFFRFFSHE